MQKLSLIEASKLNFFQGEFKHLLSLRIIQFNNFSLISTEIMKILEKPSIFFLEFFKLVGFSLNDGDDCPPICSIEYLFYFCHIV